MTQLCFDDDTKQYVVIKNNEIIYTTEDKSEAFLVLDDLRDE